MANLATTYADVRSEIGGYCGFGTDSAGWDSTQTAYVNAVLKAGLRLFFAPPLLPGQVEVHRWRFLRPLSTLTTTAGQADQTLSGAPLGIAGPLWYDTADRGGQKVELVDWDTVQERRMAEPCSGEPIIAAIVPIASAGTAVQSYQIRWYPTPAAEYTLRFEYNLDAVLLDGTNTIPMGGPDHARTLIAACLAEAEFRKEMMRGPRYQDFLSALQTSVSIDRQQNMPMSLGFQPPERPDKIVRGFPERYVNSGGFL